MKNPNGEVEEAHYRKCPNGNIQEVESIHNLCQEREISHD